jgi:hypothetical protein
MTAPVDVLAILRRMRNQAGFARNSAVGFSCEDRLRQSQADGNAVAAVAELIAADREYDAARDAYEDAERDNAAEAKVRVRLAKRRRESAIARFDDAA